ncbi:MAG: hypothetical protein R3A44_22730 [Caldilineaceae bacterium]
MSDNLRRYRAIERGLCQLYLGEPQGRLRQSLQVMAMFINGIVGSGSTHTRQVAKKTPTVAKVSSREKQLVRWYQNEAVTYESHMLPYVQELLEHLKEQTLVLVIDGSDVGRNCVTLMVSLVYQSRAIPLISPVRSGKKGHFAAEMHIELLKELRQVLPEGADVVLLGDGEFDSVELQSFLQDVGWGYVCRTAKSTMILLDDEWRRLDEIELWRGCCLPFYDVAFTQQAYGPVLAIAWWRSDCADPLYLVTNLLSWKKPAVFIASA